MTHQRLCIGMFVSLGALFICALGPWSAGAALDDSAPKVVAPGPAASDPPADAVVLFGGATPNTQEWAYADGRSIDWTVDGNALVCKPGSGSIISRKKFADAQLHIEFATPNMPDERGQGRGNSGVYVQGRYEVQVLDSFNNDTYADGSCGAGVQTIRARWSMSAGRRNNGRPTTTDLSCAQCDADGKVQTPGRLTILHNGVLIHDNIAIKELTGGSLDNTMAGPGSIMLQDHGNTVRFRNIWVRNFTAKSRTDFQSSVQRMDEIDAPSTIVD